MNKIGKIVLNAMSLLMLVACTIFLIIRWNDLSSVVVTHYNFAGEADGFGGKSNLIITLVFAWIFFVAITLVSLFPNAWNVGIKVTEKNRAQVYSIVYTMMTVIKTILVFILTYMCFCQIQGYRLPAWLTIAEIVLIFGIIIVSIVKLYKLRKM